MRLTSTSTLLPRENSTAGLTDITPFETILATKQAAAFYHKSIKLLDKFHAASSQMVHLRDGVCRKFECSVDDVVRTNAQGISTDTELTLYQQLCVPNKNNVNTDNLNESSIQVSYKDESGKDVIFRQQSESDNLTKIYVTARITRLWDDAGSTRYAIEGLVLDNTPEFDRDDYALKNYLIDSIDVSICITNMKGWLFS